MTPADISSPRYRRIVENTFLADSRMDPAGFLAGLTAGAVFVLGGLPPMRGHAAIRAMLVDTFAAFLAVAHTLHRAFEGRDLLIYEARVAYTLKDGRQVTAEYANVLEFDHDLVRHYRVYIDLSVLAP